MPQLTTPAPYSAVEPVTEMIHGVPMTDPYRWLEDQESPRTRDWLRAQNQYARAYLDVIPGRERVRCHVRKLLDVETYDSIQRAGNKYVFRKRIPGQEQPCIFLREGPEGKDQLLIDPAERKTGNHTAIQPIQLSRSGRLLLYEVKEGGERTGTFELFDLETRVKLPDSLPRGYLRGFSFAADSRGFYYVHEPAGSQTSRSLAAYHVLGTPFEHDQQVFCTSGNENHRLGIVPGHGCLGFLLFHFCDKTYVDFYLWPLNSTATPAIVIERAVYRFAPLLLNGRILAFTDRSAPNGRIVEVHPRDGREPDFVDVVPTSDWPIRNWIVTANRIYVSYMFGVSSEIRIFDLTGNKLGGLPVENHETVRLVLGSPEQEEILIERESFSTPTRLCRRSSNGGESRLWNSMPIPFASDDYRATQLWFSAKDGTQIPIFLVGRADLLKNGTHPTVMTSYGGYGVPMTPQFSIFVSLLMQRGCLFALPNIRGGSEFGVEWHNAAKRRNRQVAIDDFVAAAQWLIETKRTPPQKLAIFGGSNSGLLVAAALSQYPHLFRAVICMVPLLDMLRYHLFDNARVWIDEFGSADDPGDFAALARYSPYHQVRDGVAYPATMIVSGDADRNCNPLHARKMTARLQAANVSEFPILLDYSRFRGHSPVLPLSERVEALTDRVAFVSEQLGLLA